MKSQLSLLLLLLTVIFSCKKETTVDVTLSTSGKLTYKLVDDAGKGLPNVKVSLYDKNSTGYYNPDVLLEQQRTDANGFIDFGDLNPGIYWLSSDSTIVNNVNYLVREYVQVLTGKTRHKDTKVTDFSRLLHIYVKPYYSNNNVADLGVALIPVQKYNSSQNVIFNLNSAEYKGVTNTAGFVSIKIPSDKDYYVIVYNLNSYVLLGANYASGVERGQIGELLININ